MKYWNGCRRTILLFALCAVLLYTTSCAPAGTAATPEPTALETEEIEAVTSPDEVSGDYESEDGDLSVSVDTEGGATVPEDYPSDIAPLYPYGLVTFAGKQGDTYAIVIRTEDSLDSVYDYYSENIELDTVDIKQNSTGIVMISGARDGYYVSVMASADIEKDKNLITVSVGPLE